MAMPENTPVEPVIRAFAVLEALNLRPVNSLASLAETTRLPKPTLVRLPDTLIAAGYVRHISRRDGYALAERVVRLSGGFRHTDAVVEAARPFLSALTAEHKWPVTVATLSRDAMLIRFSTMRESPFATDTNLLNRRVAMLVSALGRAYLAWCPDDERETILELLRASPRALNRMSRDPRFVRDLIRTTRAKGFASSGDVLGDLAKGLAVPITGGGRVLATITLRYISSAVTEAEAARRYLGSMQQTARRIAAAVSQA